jgi:hypothetical protein
MSDDDQKRAETGTMRFGDDWPGVFFRGDNAFAYSVTLTRMLDAIEGAAKRSADEGNPVSDGLASLVTTSSFLRCLASDLASCDVREKPSIVNDLRRFSECLALEREPIEPAVDTRDTFCEMDLAVIELFGVATGEKR